MVIQHNLPAMNSHRQMGINNGQTSKNLEKLSSGYKINRAGDDAAGLAISEKMRGQIRGLNMATQNAENGISLIQTAEGGLNETHDILQRMRELAVQSANGTYDDATDRANLTKEVEALKSEIDRISTATNYNGISLLDGSLDPVGGTGGTPAAPGKTTTATAADFGATVAINGDKSAIPSGDYTIDFTKDATTGDTKVSIGGTDATITGAGTATAKATLADGVEIEFDDTKVQAEFDKGNVSVSIAVTGGSPESGAVPAAATKGAVVATGGTDAAADGATIAAALTTPTLTADTAGTFDFSTLTNASVALDYTTVGTETAKLTFEVGGVTKEITGTYNTDKWEFDLSTVAGAGAKFSVEAPAVNDTGTAWGAAAANGAKTATMAVTFEGKPATTGAVGTVGAATVTGAPTAAVPGAPGQELTFQIGANGSADQRVGLKVANMSSTGLGINAISVGDQTNANAAIDLLDQAINTVSGQRADLGALQNRLEHTVNNLGTTKENLQAAESSIRDVDMAKEMMEFTKNNILVQASQSMLAQSNQLPQGVLQLLR